MDNEYICESVRLCRFLYSLGFDKESRFRDDGKEYWIFKKDSDLQDALAFYFKFRRRMRVRTENPVKIEEDKNRR